MQSSLPARSAVEVLAEIQAGFAASRRASNPDLSCRGGRTSPRGSTHAISDMSGLSCRGARTSPRGSISGAPDTSLTCRGARTSPRSSLRREGGGGCGERASTRRCSVSSALPTVEKSGRGGRRCSAPAAAVGAGARVRASGAQAAADRAEKEAATAPAPSVPPAVVQLKLWQPDEVVPEPARRGGNKA